uniref:Uncharacterized protein n=1 Tax=Ditylenchus dipsaci TaxID=166011 RepID=A0A915DUG2_9BILA
MSLFVVSQQKCRRMKQLNSSDGQSCVSGKVPKNQAAQLEWWPIMVLELIHASIIQYKSFWLSLSSSWYLKKAPKNQSAKPKCLCSLCGVSREVSKNQGAKPEGWPFKSLFLRGSTRWCLKRRSEESRCLTRVVVIQVCLIRLGAASREEAKNQDAKHAWWSYKFFSFDSVVPQEKKRRIKMLDPRGGHPWYVPANIRWPTLA